MRAALFDLDGVLIDTEGTYSKFWSEMGERFNVGVDHFSDVIKGTTLDQIIGNYFPAEVHPQIIAELDVFEENMKYHTFPGVIEYLEQLKAQGIPAAMVTSSNNGKLERLWEQLPGFKDYFKVIISDADVQRSKPDPQGYLLAAQALGVKPEDCTVFEDSFNGLLAGRRAGCLVVALSTTNPAESLADKADQIIPSFKSLITS